MGLVALPLHMLTNGLPISYIQLLYLVVYFSQFRSTFLRIYHVFACFQ